MLCCACSSYKWFENSVKQLFITFTVNYKIDGAILLTTTLQWLCCGADIADDGKLCYLQGATEDDHEIVQLKQRGSNGVNKPVNCEVI